MRTSMGQCSSIVRGRGADTGGRSGCRAVLLAGLASVSSLACAGILGIEDAECDSSYDPECSSISAGGSAGASGAFGGSGPSAAGAAAVSQGGAGGTTDERPLCEQYCDRVETSCAGDNRQYASPESCLAVCDLLEPGQAGDVSGNTVQCRLSRAVLAARTGEAGTYCFSAGPGGAGICGDDCEGFCTLMTATCTELGSYADCLTTCAGVPDLSQPPSSVKFSTNVDEGNSLQCRLYHVCAATLDPVLHCQHAAGLSICAPP